MPRSLTIRQTKKIKRNYTVVIVIIVTFFCSILITFSYHSGLVSVEFNINLFSSTVLRFPRIQFALPPFAGLEMLIISFRRLTQLQA